MRICSVCPGIIYVGNEKHYVYDCPSLVDIRKCHCRLLNNSHHGGMRLFIWHPTRMCTLHPDDCRCRLELMYFWHEPLCCVSSAMLAAWRKLNFPPFPFEKPERIWTACTSTRSSCHMYEPDSFESTVRTEASCCGRPSTMQWTTIREGRKVYKPMEAKQGLMGRNAGLPRRVSPAARSKAHQLALSIQP